MRNTCYGIRKQYPTSIERRWRELYPTMRYHRTCGDNVKMVRDKLYVNGQRYDPEVEPTEEPTYSGTHVVPAPLIDHMYKGTPEDQPMEGYNQLIAQGSTDVPTPAQS